MSKQRKKTPIYVKNISPKEVGRVARKLQLEKDGEIEVSSASTSSIRVLALGFQDQYTEKQKRAANEGARQKKEKKAKQDAEILSRYEELSTKKSPRDIPSIIAKEIGLHRDTVTRIIKKKLHSR